MALEAGAVPVGNTMMGHIGCDAIEGQRPDYSLSFYYGSGKSMYVNMEGQRFCNESKSKYVVYYDILQQEEPVCWGIVDSNNPEVHALIDSNLSMSTVPTLSKNWPKNSAFPPTL